MPKTRFSIAKEDITKSIDDLSVKVMTLATLETLFENNRKEWRLAKSTTAAAFVDYLCQHAHLKRVDLKFPNRKELRYVWHDATMYEILMTLKGNPYFTHYTAMSLHQLTEQVPKITYVNCEGKYIPRAESILEQHKIDLAFRGNGRPSHNITTVRDQRVCLLNGKRTQQLGVIDGKGPEGEKIRLTNVERTLVDITVRPMYAGGVWEVLKAFRVAKENEMVSVNKLAATLKELDYVYPFHQAIGFYLERSGVYDEFSLKIFRQFKKEYDFYLTHAMKETAYSKEWRLHFPKGF